eukprot:3629253-Alexandrium_andersonii.AAC.1
MRERRAGETTRSVFHMCCSPAPSIHRHGVSHALLARPVHPQARQRDAEAATEEGSKLQDLVESMDRAALILRHVDGTSVTRSQSSS